MHRLAMISDEEKITLTAQNLDSICRRYWEHYVLGERCRTPADAANVMLKLLDDFHANTIPVDGPYPQLVMHHALLLTSRALCNFVARLSLAAWKDARTVEKKKRECLEIELARVDQYARRQLGKSLH